MSAKIEQSFEELVTSRRTIHSYRPDGVEEDVVQRALRAAHHAPNHKLTWPWRFTRVGPETRAGLSELAVRVKERQAPLMDGQRDKIVAKIVTPAELIVVSLLRCDDDFRSREDYAAASCAIQNLMLSLHADGVGSKWSTGKVTRDPETYGLLGIDETTEEIIGFIWGGIPALVPQIPRPDLDTVVRRLP